MGPCYTAHTRRWLLGLLLLCLSLSHVGAARPRTSALCRAPALCRHWGSCVLFNHLLELVFGRTHKLLHLLATLPNLPAVRKLALV